MERHDQVGLASPYEAQARSGGAGLAISTAAHMEVVDPHLGGSIAGRPYEGTAIGDVAAMERPKPTDSTQVKW